MADQYVLDRMSVLLSVALIVVLVAGATYVFTFGAQQPMQNATTNITGEVPKISVGGEAARTVLPDLLIIGIVVDSENETASGAELANARMTAKVKNALLAAGVQENEIETASYYIYPMYNNSCWYPPPCKGEVCPMYAKEEYAEEDTQYLDAGAAYSDSAYYMPPYWCEPQIIGYRAVHSIIVKTADIHDGGKIIDAVSAANTSARFEYYSFSLKDETRIRYENELAGQAAQNARSKAQSIARGLGTELGRIVDIQMKNYYMPYYGIKDYTIEGAERMGYADSVEPIAMQIFPQHLTLSSYIYVTFEISQ